MVKNLGNGWSKSFVVENKEVLHFDFRNEAKKSGHLDHPLQSYGQIYFNIFWYISAKAGLLQGTSKTKIVSGWKDIHWTTCGLCSHTFSPPEPPQKMSLSENVIFWGLRLSLGHFGRQVPGSPVSQLQNCVSTSSRPPILLTSKVYPRTTSFFQWEF